MAEVPRPKRGGTFFYCPEFMRAHYDPPMYCARFRTAKAYRRHWRRFHG